jgi:hypothetical protein
MPVARYTKMKAITTVARILQIVNSTNFTVSPNITYSPTASMIQSVTVSPSPSSIMSVTSFVSYTPLQTFNMSSYYSATVSPMPSPTFVSISYSASASASASPSASITPTATATQSPRISANPKLQSSSPFSSLTPEQWAYILVPCICFAVITWWCNIKLWSRVDDLDHQLKLYQSTRIQNNPMNHNSIRNIIPGLPTPTGNKASYNYV